MIMSICNENIILEKQDISKKIESSKRILQNTAVEVD